MQTRKAKTFVCTISCIVQETNLVKWSIRSVQYLFRLSFSVRFLSKPTITDMLQIYKDKHTISL